LNLRPPGPQPEGSGGSELGSTAYSAIERVSLALSGAQLGPRIGPRFRVATTATWARTDHHESGPATRRERSATRPRNSTSAAVATSEQQTAALSQASRGCRPSPSAGMCVCGPVPHGRRDNPRNLDDCGRRTGRRAVGALRDPARIEQLVLVRPRSQEPRSRRPSASGRTFAVASPGVLASVAKTSR
jgi:hypothetical protein